MINALSREVGLIVSAWDGEEDVCTSCTERLPHAMIDLSQNWQKHEEFTPDDCAVTHTRCKQAQVRVVGCVGEISGDVDAAKCTPHWGGDMSRGGISPTEESETSPVNKHNRTRNFYPRKMSKGAQQSTSSTICQTRTKFTRKKTGVISPRSNPRNHVS